VRRLAVAAVATHGALATLATLATLGGCTGVGADPGLDAELRVAGAQFYDGAMPAPAAQTHVISVDSPSNTVRAGQIGKSLSGLIERDGAAVALGFAGDAGYWIVPAGALDTTQGDLRDWSVKVSFAPKLAVGARDLEVAAVDAAGRFGPPATLTLNVRPHEVDLTDTSLVISLSWDTEADLDLHVVLPGAPANIVWAQHPTSIGHAEGTVVDSDTRGGHVAGSGVRALTFSY